jgi:predicted nuclease with TOPRIM domain
MADEKKRRMTPEELRDKIGDLQKRHQAVLEKRASLGGQLEAKKQELQAIVQEIKAAGYDPKNLATEYEKAHQDVEAMALDLESKLTEVETALAAFDKK